MMTREPLQKYVLKFSGSNVEHDFYLCEQADPIIQSERQQLEDQDKLKDRVAFLENRLRERIDERDELRTELASVREERDLFKASMHERLADYGEVCDRERLLKQRFADLRVKYEWLEQEVHYLKDGRG